MTYQTRAEIFSKEALSIEDMMKQKGEYENGTKETNG